MSTSTQSWLTQVPTRKPREEPDPPWSLARQNAVWTHEEKRILGARWPNPEVLIEAIAAELQRSVASVRMAAVAAHLGHRPPEQSFGSGTRGKPMPPRRAAASPHDDDDEGPPPPLRPTRDGVVMTRRLNQAWDRVNAGEAIADVARIMRLPAVEVLALRRWSGTK